MNYMAAAFLFFVASEWAPSLLVPCLSVVFRKSLVDASAFEGVWGNDIAELLRVGLGQAKRFLWFDAVPRWLLRVGCVLCLLKAL